MGAKPVEILNVSTAALANITDASGNILVSLNVALDESIDSIQAYNQGSNVVVGGVIATAQEATFANSATANTEATPIDIAQPASPRDVTALLINNPSTVTDVTLQLFSYNGSNYYHIEDLSIPAKAAVVGTEREYHKREVRGCFTCGDDLRIIVSIDSSIGAADTFAVTVSAMQV